MALTCQNIRSTRGAYDGGRLVSLAAVTPRAESSHCLAIPRAVRPPAAGPLHGELCKLPLVNLSIS